MMGAIDADTDDDNHAVPLPSLALDQDSGHFGGVAQKIVRPFEAEARRERGGGLEKCIVERERRNERQLGRALRRRRITQQEARIEIAGLGDPCPPAPASPRGLPACRDP